MSIAHLALELNIDGEITVRDYLVELLSKLWSDKESFSGKRPFGDSGWEYTLYELLQTAGLATDNEKADRIIRDCITLMGKKS